MKNLSAVIMGLLLVTGLTVLGCSPQMSGPLGIVESILSAGLIYGRAQYVLNDLN